MESTEVRIVQLPPMRVATALGFGTEPEFLSQEMLLGWARSRRLLEGETSPRFFGFNNPDPSVGSVNYGYEFWMTVGADVQAEAPVQIKDFTGGLYAVRRCQGIEHITQAWKDLVAWLETSPYRMGPYQWLEEHIRFQNVPLEEYTLDLYLPVMK